MRELLLVKDLFGINELHAKYTPDSVKRNARLSGVLQGPHRVPMHG
jgi:hypothetical protein